MVIAAILVLNLFAFYCFVGLDYYMKLRSKPIIRKKVIRYLFFHSGSYYENVIKLDRNPCLIPSDDNKYTISKSVFWLEIANLVYTLTAIALDIVYLTTDNRLVSLISIVMLAVYFVVLIVLTVLGMVKTAQEEKRQWGRKYEQLTKNGIQCQMSFEEATDYLQQGKKLFFNLYDISLALETYKTDSVKGNIWQLTDKTHKVIWVVNRSLEKIVDSISVNMKTLRELWPYLNITISEND